MKKISLLIFVFTMTLPTFSQGTLEQLFYDLPAAYAMEFDQERRKEEVALMKENVRQNYYESSFIDERNGYLIRYGYQCAYQLCYWKNPGNDSLSAGKKLVAVIQGCQEKPDFLLEEDGKFTEVSFSVIENFDARYFFKKGTKTGVIKPYLDDFHFELPRQGKNILVRYGSLYGEQERTDLLKGDKIELIWQNGDFVMGEPYF